jgi:hypothetical protein
MEKMVVVELMEAKKLHGIDLIRRATTGGSNERRLALKRSSLRNDSWIVMVKPTARDGFRCI